MNEFEPVSASQIERLVDGELTQAERRSVLMKLDQDGEGWRRLALAFLESQALREGLRRPVRTLSPASVAPVSIARVTASAEAVTPASSRTSSKSMAPMGRSLQWIAAMTICCAVMFGLGRWSGSGSNESIVAASLPSQPLTLQPLTSQPQPSPPVTYQADNDVPPAVNEQQMVAAAGPVSSHQQQTLRLELNDAQGGAAQTVDVPVVENSGLRAEDLLNAPPVVSDAVQRSLLKHGHRIYEQRHLYEVTLEDGRRGIVPVSDVFVENAGWDIYQ